MRPQMMLKTGERVRFQSHRRIVSWEHGYVWIGNDDPHDKECFATLDRDFIACEPGCPLKARPHPTGPCNCRVGKVLAATDKAIARAEGGGQR